MVSEPQNLTDQPEAKRLITDAYDGPAYDGPTSYRSHSTTPRVGTAPPMPQTGRAPMSQRAVDVSTMMLSASAATIPPGAIVIGVMLASGSANPTVIGMICAAPAAVAVPVFAIARVLRRAKDVVQAAPPTHHHYEGTVVQDHSSITTTTRGMIALARTNNDLRRR
jgi:hypothetical protein